MAQDSETRDPLRDPTDPRGTEVEAPLSPGELLAPRPLAPERQQPAAEPLRLPSAARADPSEHARYLARRHFGALDGLRALGILAVVWHHTVGGPGRFGANLFFLLSGFLVTTILQREARRTGSVAVTRFRARRARRLYPLYFAVLALYVGVVALLEPPGPVRAAFFGNLPAFATFTSNWLVGLEGERVVFYFAWSLAAQEQFYLLWPLFLKHVSVRTCAGALGSLLATAYLTRAGLFDLALAPGTFGRTLVLSLMPALLLGSLLALTLDTRAGFERVRRALGGRWASCALLALALFLWRSPSVPEICMHATLTALAAACVVREDHVLARLLCLRPVAHVGAVSYGIYLLHMLCHNAVERGLTRIGAAEPALDFALTAALAIALATLSHRYFESLFLPADKRPQAARAAA
jgi:peptidoglycan/LPS O-acetylase OafA/YrhL